MNKIIRTVILLICLYALSLTNSIEAYSATYYIDYVSGSDSNNGTTQSAPWKYCPGDPRANSGHTLTNGDVVYFKRGVTYTGGGTQSWAISTKSQGVTYTVTDWGTGNATIDAAGSSSILPDACFEVIHANTTIDGGTGKNFVLTGVNINHAAVWCYGNSSGISGDKFTNLKVQSVGSSNSEEGIGIKVGGNSYAYTGMEISNNIISTCYSAGIKISGNGTTADIFGNDISASGYLPLERCQVNISSNNPNGIQVNFYNNIVHNSSNNEVNGININSSTGSKIFNNDIYGNTGAGITLDPTYGPHTGTIDVFKNNIHDNTGQYDEGIRVGASDSTRYARIWNNLIYNNGTNNYQIRTIAGSNYTKIWNNTIYTSNGTGGINVFDSTASNTEIINNLIVVNGFYCIMTASATIKEDYNLCYSIGNGSNVIGKTAGGNDKIGQNPLLYSPPTVFSLQDGSPASAGGISNPGSGAFSDDYTGSNRPLDRWSNGAYSGSLNLSSPYISHVSYTK